MNLIVFDLEWNIGYQPKTFLYHGTELTLSLIHISEPTRPY